MGGPRTRNLAAPSGRGLNPGCGTRARLRARRPGAELERRNGLGSGQGIGADRRIAESRGGARRAGGPAGPVRSLNGLGSGQGIGASPNGASETRGSSGSDGHRERAPAGWGREPAGCAAVPETARRRASEARSAERRAPRRGPGRQCVGRREWAPAVRRATRVGPGSASGAGPRGASDLNPKQSAEILGHHGRAPAGSGGWRVGGLGIPQGEARQGGPGRRAGRGGPGRAGEAARRGGSEA